MTAIGQEVHYFDEYFYKSDYWYRAHFPTYFSKKQLASHTNKEPMIGESSPYYMFHPLAPERMDKVLREPKLIFLLRNPIDRAYSHYRHEVRKGNEKLSFEEALDQEENRLEGAEEHLESSPRATSFPHKHYSYKKRGIYIEQIGLVAILSKSVFMTPF
jgi:hypothetical protein